MQKPSTRASRIAAAARIRGQEVLLPESPFALRVPYLDRQPWECATVLADGTLCGLPIIDRQFRWCEFCASHFRSKRKSKP